MLFKTGSARCDASPVLKAAEHALDRVAVAVGSLAVGGRIVAPLSRRDARFDTARRDGVAQRVTIISLVADQRLGGYWEHGQNGRRTVVVANLAFGEQQDDRAWGRRRELSSGALRSPDTSR